MAGVAFLETERTFATRGLGGKGVNQPKSLPKPPQQHGGEGPHHLGGNGALGGVTKTRVCCLFNAARAAGGRAAAHAAGHRGGGDRHTLRWLTGVVTLRGYTQGLRTQQKQNGNGVHTMSILRDKVRAVHVGDYVKNLNLDREYRCKRNSSCAKGGARGGTCCPPKCWRSPPTDECVCERAFVGPDVRGAAAPNP